MRARGRWRRHLRALHCGGRGGPQVPVKDALRMDPIVGACGDCSLSRAGGRSGGRGWLRGHCPPRERGPVENERGPPVGRTMTPRTRQLREAVAPRRSGGALGSLGPSVGDGGRRAGPGAGPRARGGGRAREFRRRPVVPLWPHPGRLCRHLRLVGQVTRGLEGDGVSGGVSRGRVWWPCGPPWWHGLARDLGRVGDGLDSPRFVLGMRAAGEGACGPPVRRLLARLRLRGHVQCVEAGRGAGRFRWPPCRRGSRVTPWGCLGSGDPHVIEENVFPGTRWGR